MRYVLALSIGPVQDFIAAARKARDLWYGSHLLSETARAVAAKLADQGAQLVFPTSEAIGEENVSVANKIVALLPEGLDPAQAATRAKEAGQEYLDQQAKAALRIIGANAVHQDAYFEQIGAFLEFYAAWSPLETEDGYHDARQAADRLLAGRKALRNFAQPKSEDGRPKSSLDGGRDTVLVKERPAHPRIKQAEQLDAISLVKRMTPDNKAPSVSASRVAVDPVIRRLASTRQMEELKAQAAQMVQAGSEDISPLSPTRFPQFADFPYDTQLFYSVNADEPNERTQKFQETVAKMTREAKIGEILPYFATLAADGDRMGKVIGALKTAKQHQALSSALNGFAQAAQEIVARNSGALLYSGGDDVMAFLPLDKALACADELREEFTARLGRIVDADPPTLSVGLSIAHSRAHLDSLLDWARKAEKLAKTKRNALAVTWRPRSSGEEFISVLDSWSKNPLSKWAGVIDLRKSSALPNNAAYKLRQLADEMEKAQPGDPALSLGAVGRAEAGRILKRARESGGGKFVEDTKIKYLLAQIEDTPESLRILVNRILIARAFARAEQTADPEQEITDGADVYSTAA